MAILSGFVWLAKGATKTLPNVTGKFTNRHFKVKSVLTAEVNFLEITMDFRDLIMIGGIGLSLGACAFLIAAQLRSAKQAGARDVCIENARRSERLDLYMGAVWSGFLVVQATSIFRHVEPGGTFRFSLLSLAAFASVVFICGGFAGRLQLRRDMRVDQRSANRAEG